jgi:hypothetical protein
MDATLGGHNRKIRAIPRIIPIKCQLLIKTTQLSERITSHVPLAQVNSFKVAMQVVSPAVAVSSHHFSLSQKSNMIFSLKLSGQVLNRTAVILRVL